MGRRVEPGIELGEVDQEVLPAALGLLDHRRQPVELLPERLDLAVDPPEGVVEDRAPLGRVGGRAEPVAVASPGRLVLEELADLGQAEPGVVAEALDEAEALDVVRVVLAVVALRPAGRLEESELLVVADRPGGEPELGGDLVDPEEVLRVGRRGGIEMAHAGTMMPQPCR